MTSSMDMASKNGPTKQDTKVDTLKVKNTGKVLLFGLISRATKENSKIIISTESGNTLGPTAVPIKVTGKRIRCMVKASLSGRMEGRTTASIRMTRKTATAFSSGRTVVNTPVNGRTESNMERGSTSVAIKLREKANGEKAVVLNG